MRERLEKTLALMDGRPLSELTSDPVSETGPQSARSLLIA